MVCFDLLVDRHSLELVEKKSWNQLRNWGCGREVTSGAITRWMDWLAVQVISPHQAPSPATSTHVHVTSYRHPATAGRKKGLASTATATSSNTRPWPPKSSPCLHNQTFSTTSFSVCPPGASGFIDIAAPQLTFTRSKDVRAQAGQDLAEHVVAYTQEYPGHDASKGVWAQVFHKTFEFTRSNNQLERLGAIIAICEWCCRERK